MILAEITHIRNKFYGVDLPSFTLSVSKDYYPVIMQLPNIVLPREKEIWK